MSDVEIKPCPFCGGESRLKSHCNAEYCSCECNSCKVQGRIVETREEAMENWNTRRPDRAIENAAYERAAMELPKAPKWVNGLINTDECMAVVRALKSSPTGEACT